MSGCPRCGGAIRLARVTPGCDDPALAMRLCAAGCCYRCGGALEQVPGGSVCAGCGDRLMTLGAVHEALQRRRETRRAVYRRDSVEVLRGL